MLILFNKIKKLSWKFILLTQKIIYIRFIIKKSKFMTIIINKKILKNNFNTLHC